MSEEAFPFNVGDVIKDRYKIVRNISQGNRSAIFCALDQKMRQFAVKLEKNSGLTQVCIEAAILNILAGSKHIPQFFYYGQHQDYKFLAQELLGTNMIELVDYNKHLKYSLHSVLKFGIQAIEAIQIVHKQGFVHRDIKPGNFLIGNTQGTTSLFYLTDFGLCKKLNIVNGIVSMPTNKAKFRGSMTYASLNAHNYVELGRQDDLISLLYILVEFFNGILPWSGIEDAEKVKKLKLHYIGIKLLKRLPIQFLEFESYILSLDYTTDPDYEYLISLLKQAASDNEIDLNAPFEWEEEINDERDRIIKHQITYAQKVHDKIEQLENEKLLIQVYNEKDDLEQIEQVDKEIDELKQAVLTPKQFQIKLNTLNIIHRLRNKHDNYYQQERLKQMQKSSNRHEIPQYDVTSCIVQVKSYNQYNQLPDLSDTKTNSHSPMHSPIPKKYNNADSRENILVNTFSISPQQDQQSNQNRRDTNTIQDLVDILDAISGASADISININNPNQQIMSTRQQDRNNFIDQFKKEMKQQGKKPNEIDWDQFINNVGGSSENEQFDTFNTVQHNEIFNGVLSPQIDIHEILMIQSINQQENKNKTELDLPSSVFTPPITEYKQTTSPCYSPLLLPSANSSYRNSPKSQQILNNQFFIFAQHPTTEEQLDLDFEHPKQTNQQSLFEANTVHNKFGNDFHVKLKQRCLTDENQKNDKELNQQQIEHKFEDDQIQEFQDDKNEDIDHEDLFEVRNIDNEQKMDQNLEIDINQKEPKQQIQQNVIATPPTIKTRILQQQQQNNALNDPMQIIDISNDKQIKNIENLEELNYENEDQLNQDRIEGKEERSPFQVRQELNIISLINNNLFTKQTSTYSSSQYSEQHPHSQIFSDQSRNAAYTESKVEQSYNNTNNTNSFGQIIPNTTSNKVESRQFSNTDNINSATNIHSAWDIDANNQQNHTIVQNEKEQIKLDSLDELKMEQKDKQNINSHPYHNQQSHIQNSNSDNKIEVVTNKNKSCCVIL